jgi:hypothetical protein
MSPLQRRCRDRWIGPGLGLAAALGLACGTSALTGGGASPATTDSEERTGDRRSEPDMAATAEVGALSEAEAQRSFEAALGPLQACIEAGAERVPVLGGSIELAVKIDTTGTARRVWAPSSTLGDRQTEKCMFDAVRQVRWPAPLGGAFGIARNSFEFRRSKRVGEPGVWDSERVIPVLEAIQEALEECRSGSAGEILVTLYIGTGGRALAGGAASEESVADEALDCVVETLLAADYPPPEQSPTQVRFRL